MPKTTEQIEQHISAAMAAARLCVSPRTITNAVRRGEIKAVVLSGKYLINSKSLEAWLKARTVEVRND